jgi:hypothetical protein
VTNRPGHIDLSGPFLLLTLDAKRWTLMKRALRIAVPVAMIGALATFVATRPERIRVIGTVPDRIADTTFWRMIGDMSEPDGSFHSNNFVSNETELQHVIPSLQQRVAPRGVYLGVGPEQNFTYIVGFRPRIAFIVDIRRQNAMAHLMYKALIETSTDRADFLARLFSRPRPAYVDTNAKASDLVAAFSSREADSDLRDTTMLEITDHLRRVHGFPITDEDLASVEFVHGAFYEMGIDLTYSSGGSYVRRASVRTMPSFAWLMAESDGEGVERGFLATEANFRALQDMERRNLIVPLVGDFAGPKALRAVARWLKERDARVNIYYLSNVEQYLFQNGDAWRSFYDNVEALPRDSSSTFIRSIANQSRRWAPGRPLQIAQCVQPIAELLDAFHDKHIRTYGDVIRMSRGDLLLRLPTGTGICF